MAIKFEIKDSLREVRKSKGLTQAELAEKIGVTQAAIAKYESGEREPSFSTIAKIEEILNHDFINVVVEPNPLHVDESILFFEGFCNDSFKLGETDDGIELVDFRKNGKQYTFEITDVNKLYKRVLKHAEIEFNALLETCKNVHDFAPDEI